MSNSPNLVKNNRLDYSAIIKKHPWIIKRNQRAIISPDSDGILSGLFMSHMFDWEIVGFYDGKLCLIKDGAKADDCIFLDMEIFRKNIKSVGHHMVLYNKNRTPDNWDNFQNCIQPNIIRGYDAYTFFPLKYPLANIHLLLGIVGSVENIDITKPALCPLLYTDGTFKNLFNFPENCISWIDFLGGTDVKNPLHKIFYNKHYLISDLMLALNEFFEKLSGIGKGADKIKISDANSNLVNMIKNIKNYSMTGEYRAQKENFIEMLSQLTGWKYTKDHWHWSNFRLLTFTKESLVPSNGRFDAMIKNNPLSLAMTSGLAIEYTLETPDFLY